MVYLPPVSSCTDVDICGGDDFYRLRCVLQEELEGEVHALSIQVSSNNVQLSHPPMTNYSNNRPPNGPLLHHATSAYSDATVSSGVFSRRQPPTLYRAVMPASLQAFCLLFSNDVLTPYIQAKTPTQWETSQLVEPSPKCAGGGGK